MTVLRVRKKTTNFLVLDKTCLTQSNLSWGAKGLHSYLMSLPSEWRVNVHDLKKRASNGRDSVRGLINELEQAGYIIKEQIRDEVTGKFSCLEYIINEVPEQGNSESPSTENPETAFPVSVNPGTEMPTLINNNSNKYTKKKIIRAAAKEDCDFYTNQRESRKAAAAFSGEYKQPPEKTPKVSFINPSSSQDSIIGKELTPYQLKRLESLVTTVLSHGFNVTFEEIRYCLLSPEYFKGCGREFGKKLNAIRTVILRGDWQTPVWLIHEEGMVEVNRKGSIDRVKLEIKHFQRLLESVKGAAREGISDILTGLKMKVRELEAASYKGE